jgi:2-C-methyl-D-erythritol 2,4-cyclodiphosphate synthase
MRIGSGYDLHRLVTGKELFLGGVRIPSDKGTVAHSDGDVLIHAICDAFLGAMARGDIGDMFPDDDPAYAGARSSLFLEEIKDIYTVEGFALGNLDCTVYIERPKLGPYKADIRKSIVRMLGVKEHMVNIKAKTAESTGVIGSGDAVAASAVVLLEEI